MAVRGAPGAFAAAICATSSIVPPDRAHAGTVSRGAGVCHLGTCSARSCRCLASKDWHSERRMYQNSSTPFPTKVKQLAKRQKWPRYSLTE